MRKAATVVVATSLVVMVFAGIQPSGGQDPEGAEALGVYHRLGSDNDLTSEHVSWNGEALEVEGPAFTEKLEIEQTYLEEELGAWGSFQKFSVDKGIVQIDHAKAAFEAFNLGEEPIFTQGAGDQVKLLERPMWLNASQEVHGEQITLTMEDGDSSGQQIFISRDWLWERGIQRFNVTHEDGSLLPVTEQSGGVVVDVPHFSELNINPDELDVKQVVEGVTVDNLGDTRWHWQESVLEVDVDNNPSGDYEVLISADWLDLHIRPETFNVYSSKELVESDPDTGIQVCCGGGGSSQDYYSVKFSTSGSSVMIEVIGEHLPVYTVQDGDLAPHWGEKRWNETALVLEVDVEEQSAEYEIWVEKEWADVEITDLALEDHLWTVTDQGSETYYVVEVAPFMTPETLVFRPFILEGEWLFSAGSENTIEFSQPIRLSSSLEHWNLTVLYDSPLDSSINWTKVQFNGTFAEMWNIQNPSVSNQGNPIEWDSGEDGSFSFNITNPEGVFAVEAVWKPIEEFVGLPDPEEWLVDPESGLHYRRTTEAEREMNGWVVGSYLVETRNSILDGDAQESMSLLFPYNDTETQNFNLTVDKVDETTSTASYINGESHTFNSTIYYYIDGVTNSTGALMLATKNGGISGHGVIDNRVGSIQGPKTHWEFDLDQVPNPVDLVLENVTLVQFIFRGHLPSINVETCVIEWPFVIFYDPCPDDGDGGDPPPENQVTFNFGLYGEVKWCTENEGSSGDDWIPEAHFFADTVTSGFSNTLADLDNIINHCWIADSMAEANECDEDGGCYGNCEDGVCLDYYPYNGCASDSNCYRSNVWSDVDLHRDHSTFAGLKVANVIHQGMMENNMCGKAYSSGTGFDEDGAGVSADWRNYGGCARLVHTHEIGHNFNAKHSFASEVEGCWSVMQTTSGVGGEEGCRMNHFSDQNTLERVNPCKDDSSCPRSGER